MYVKTVIFSHHGLFTSVASVALIAGYYDTSAHPDIPRVVGDAGNHSVEHGQLRVCYLQGGIWLHEAANRSLFE